MGKCDEESIVNVQKKFSISNTEDVCLPFLSNELVKRATEGKIKYKKDTICTLKYNKGHLRLKVYF